MSKRRSRSLPLPSGAKRARGGSQRQLRVGEELRHALSEILREGRCRDPVLENVSITVTEVSVSPDLRNATAFVMPLAGANAAEVVAALGRCAPLLQGLAARELALRHAPHLGFALDVSFEQAERISSLLRRPEVARDLRPETTETEDRREEC